MNDSAGARTPAYGYFREQLFMGARQKAEIRDQLAASAERRGYELGKVFEEKVETMPDAFAALVAAAMNDHAAVIVPNLEHLSGHGDPMRLRHHLAEATGQEVIIADPQ